MSNSHIALALARPAEATAIARMSRELIEAGLDWAWTPARVASRIGGRETNVVVARVASGRIAGFGIMRYGDESAHLDLLGVIPECRGRGLGRHIVEWLERPAIAAGIAAVSLEVRLTNDGAQACYRRLGYREIEQIPGYYQGLEAAVRMRRSLAVDPVASSR